MNEERLSNIRHSLSHLLATVVREKDPGVKLAIGPVIENGFYYDFEFSKDADLRGMNAEERGISEKDLPRLQKRIKELVRQGLSFVSKEVSVDEARKLFVNQPYKLELIEEFAQEDRKLTVYETGNFVDLCKGGHVENTKEIDTDAFKITHIAGAYWRGDEKNKMLTRIYGLAFENKDALDTYLKNQEEAKKRDHRKLGKDLEIFTIIDDIGPGLPLFYPNGAILRRLVERYIEEEQEKRGYQPIWIPHITKGKLYETSGHLDKYDAMYPPMNIDENDYYLKPMNCPHFMMLYKTQQHSYRDLPLRYTSTTTNYRYEKSGELSGLTRVRALTQDDCHVFCEPPQIEDEIKLMLEMIGQVYKKFGLNDFWVRFPTALFGALTPIFLFFFIRNISKNKTLAYFSAFSLAISPQHVLFSRSVNEAVIALFFLLLGLFLVMRLVKKWSSFILFGAGLLLTLSVYTYRTFFIFTPLILGLFIFYIRKLGANGINLKNIYQLL